MQIYVSKDGAQAGPFPIEEVQEMVEAGQYSLNDTGSTDALTDWMPLRCMLTEHVAQPSQKHQLAASSTLAAASPASKTLGVAGVIMYYGAMATVGLCWINCIYNHLQENLHPYFTFFSGGSNLSSYGYNFLPPSTGFEFVVVLIGVIGFILIKLSVALRG